MGTRYRGVEREVQALDAFIKLMRAANTVRIRVHRHLHREGLTESQFGALETLHHLGPMSQGRLARKILKSGANMTLVLDNLEKRGLVERQREVRDRRMVRVRLTPAGTELVASIFPRHVRGVIASMARLSGGEQMQLGALCKKLGQEGSAAEDQL